MPCVTPNGGGWSIATWPSLGGLLWTDIDLDGNSPTVTISGSMKHEPGGVLRRGKAKRSTAGERTLAAPPVLVEALREHQKRQAAGWPGGPESTGPFPT